MTPDEVTRMAREAGGGLESYYMNISALKRFAALVSAHERKECAKVVSEFAQNWWSIHCASNKHMETTRKAHDDFCALQSAIRARGQAEKQEPVVHQNWCASLTQLLTSNPPQPAPCNCKRPAAPVQEPVGCRTLCELCVKRGYDFCANAVKTTPIPTPDG